MIDTIVCIMMNLCRIVLTVEIIRILAKSGERETDRDRQMRILFFVLYFTVNTALYLSFHMVWVNFVSNLIGIALIAITYTKKLQMVLFMTGSVYLINIGCNTIAVLPFVAYKDGVGFNQLYEVITLFLMLLCKVLIERLVESKEGRGGIRHISFGLMPLCSIGILCLLVYSDSCTNMGLVFVSAGLIILNFFAFYLYGKLSESYWHELENQELNREIAYYSNQLNIMVQSEKKVKALRHDMKHHMNELKILAEKGESSSIVAYINDMKDFVTNPEEIVSSGNMEIDSVLNFLLVKAKNELMKVNVHVDLPESLLHTFDINVILGNLLENAIEAARQSAEKRLDVSVVYRKGILHIIIENSYTSVPDEGRRGFTTTKKEAGEHGIGLENVKRIVAKNNGVLEVKTEKDTFCVNMVLYLAD